MPCDRSEMLPIHSKLLKDYVNPHLTNSLTLSNWVFLEASTVTGNYGLMGII